MKLYIFYLNIFLKISLTFAHNYNSSGIKICPSVFVYAEDSSEPEIQFIEGTNCATKCISPVWSHSEWKVLLSVCTVAMWIGMPLDIFVIITWSLSKKNRNQYFVLTFAICSFIMQITLVISSFYSMEDIHCRNVAVPMGYRDGFTLCNVQSFLFVYGSFGASISWMLQSFDLFMKVVLKKNDTKQFKTLFIGLIFGLPPCLLLTIGLTRSYGYQPGIPMCMVGGIYATYCIYIPLILCLVFGAGPIFAVIFVIVMHTRRIHSIVAIGNTHHSKRNDMFKMVKGSALFVLSYFMLAIPVHTYRLYCYIYFHNGATVEIADLSSWYHCIFQHYDGVDDASWVSICGAVPPRRVPIALAMFHGLSGHGTGLLISSTYIIQPSFWKIWKSWLKLDSVSLSVSRLYSKKVVLKKHSAEEDNKSKDPPIDMKQKDVGNCNGNKKIFISLDSFENSTKDKYIIVDVDVDQNKVLEPETKELD